MRLWSLHPKYLDRRGLVALWREGLLAQAVLRGRTRGYRRHPQLIRFRKCQQPVAAIADYLRVVREEASRRGYNFDESRLSRAHSTQRVEVPTGQLLYEWKHLSAKVRRRDPAWFRTIAGERRPKPHPMFRTVKGEMADWERVS